LHIERVVVGRGQISRDIVEQRKIFEEALMYLPFKSFQVSMGWRG